MACTKGATAGRTIKFTGALIDLIFGRSSFPGAAPRAQSGPTISGMMDVLATSRAPDNAKEKFAKDFVAACTKVMDHDRFDVSSGG